MSSFRGNKSNLLPPQYIRTFQFPVTIHTLCISLRYLGLQSVPEVQQTSVISQHWWCASSFTLFHTTPQSYYGTSL